MRHLFHHLAHDGKSRIFVFVSLALTSLFLYLSVTAVVEDIVVFADGMRNGFSVGGQAKHDLSFSAYTHSGDFALAFIPEHALILRTSSPIDLTGYAGLEFWIRGDSAGGQDIALQFISKEEVVYQLPLDDALAQIPSDRWELVKIPLHIESVDALRFVSPKKQAAIYLDDIRFVRAFSTFPASEEILIYDGHAHNGFIVSRPDTDQILFYQQAKMDVSSLDGIEIGLQTDDPAGISVSLDDHLPVSIASLGYASDGAWKRFLLPFADASFERLRIQLSSGSEDVIVGDIRIKRELYSPHLSAQWQWRDGNIHVELTNIGTGTLIIQEVSLAQDTAFTLDFSKGKCESIGSKETCAFEIYLDLDAQGAQDTLVITSNDKQSSKTAIVLS